jgi:hypothetical protein
VWETAKAVPRGKIIPLSIYIKKVEKTGINHMGSYTTKIEKRRESETQSKQKRNN